MGKVLISDIIQPAVWLPYVQEQIVQVNRLIASGIIYLDDLLSQKIAGGGAPFINVPNYSPMTGTSQVLSDSGDLSVGGISTARQIAYALARGDARSVNDLAKWRSGDDPAKAIGNGWANWWTTDEQAILVAILTGIFADNVTNDTSDLVHDISIEDGNNAVAENKMSGTAVLTATQKMGDAKAKMVGIAMHSQVESNLSILDQIETIRDSEGNIVCKTYKGLEVFVDDTMPVTAGGTSGFKYTSYLLAKNSIGRGEHIDKDTGFESDRDILAGDSVMTMRRQICLHPYGFAAAYAAGDLAGDTAANTELDDEAAWNRVWNKKNCGVVAIVTNG